MRSNFILPSCNYNIVLTKEDVERLMTKGYITMNPSKTSGVYHDECGMKCERNGHSLTYSDTNNEHNVQFVAIILDK